MDSKESLSNASPNTSQPTGWESVAEMADKPTTFEQAIKDGEEKMIALDEKYTYYYTTELGTRSLRPSDFKNTFNFFKTRCHEKSAECINAAVERAIKLAEEDDPEIGVIRHSGRAGISSTRWPLDSIGKFGTGEYILETLGSRSTPENIGRLQLIMKSIPSTDYAKYETTRIDATRIENKVIVGRSFIHDCAPEAHKLIKAMVEYYDAKNDPELLEKKEKELADTLQELRTKYGAGYKEKHENLIFDLENYDEPAGKYNSTVGSDKKTSDEAYNGNKGEERAIDVLRRLEKNMEPTPIEAPKTKIPELNDAFDKLGQVPINEQTGELRIELKDLKDILNIINTYLIENRGKRTLYPSTIAAVTYIDKLSATVLKNLSKEEWQEIAFDPTFKEMLRFSQLTMSGEYDQDNFETYYSYLIKKAGKAFGEDEVDDEAVSKAFGIVQSQTLKNTEAVAKSFSNEQGREYLASAVWSGNLTHELIGLSEKY